MAAWDPGGALGIARVPGGWRITNGTRFRLGAGTLVDGATAYEVAAIESGGLALITMPMSLAPQLPLLAPFQSEGPAYLSPAEDGWVVVHLSERP